MVYRILPSSKFGQARHFAVHAAADRGTDDEHRAGRAVIGAQIGVLAHPPAEFTEHHHRHVVGSSEPLHVQHERGDVVRYVGQQPSVGVGLIDVRVERVARIGHVEDPRPEPGGDQGGDAIQPEPGKSVVDR